MPAVLEAVPNFSEGRDRSLIDRLAAGDGVLDLHADRDHHRSVVTLADCRAERLVDSVLSRVALAVERIDLRMHKGLHPRVGVADVVPLVPLGSATMDEAMAAARQLADRIWCELCVPVCFYGAMANSRRLAEIRRGGIAPDVGDRPHPSAGVCCVGSRPPLVAYNLVFELPRQRVVEVAAAMRLLPGVQALTLPLPDGRSQLSLNLTRLEETDVSRSFSEATRLAGTEPVPELVGLCPAAAAGPGCDGGLLEARLAAAAARQGAAAARGRGGDEHALLASRMDAAARGLERLTSGQEALLAGAEQAVALRRVLAAAGLGGECALAMLQVAAEGMRAALGAALAGRFGSRLALVDRWLAEDQKPRT